MTGDVDQREARRLFGKFTDDRYRGDTGAAYRHAKAAADEGLSYAAYAVYRMHRDGTVTRDAERERVYLEKAAREGHLYARRELLRRALAGRPSGLMWLVLRLRYLAVMVRVRLLRALAPEDDRLRR